MLVWRRGVWMKPLRLFRSTAIVSAGTALSRVLGFVREVLMAWLFGTSLAKSAFDVAFRIPNLFRRLLGEGALSAAFVPIFAETLKREGPEEAARLLSRVATLLGAVLTVVTGLGIAAIWWIEHTWEFGERMAAVLPLLRIMLPYALFICLSALSMGVLNTFGYFAVPALAPVLLNLVWTAALLWVCPRLGGTADEQIYWLAWCITGAGLLQLAAQLPMLRMCGMRLRLQLQLGDARVRRVLLLTGPAALGMGVHQLNTVVSGFLALFIGDWAPAALTYAERLIYLPLGIIATALGTVLLPAFSHQVAADQQDAMRSTLCRSLRAVLLAMIPAAMGLFVLADPIVRLSYAWRGGLFDAESTVQTVRAVAFYAPGLVVFSIYKVIVPVFYALKDTATPVRVGLWAVGLNFLLNIGAVLWWPTQWAHAGLALATVVASAINCFVLARILTRRLGDPGWRLVRTSGMRALVAASGMGVAAWQTQHVLATQLAARALNEKLIETISVGAAIAVGITVYVVVLALVSRDELGLIVRARRKRAGPSA